VKWLAANTIAFKNEQLLIQPLRDCEENLVDNNSKRNNNDNNDISLTSSSQAALQETQTNFFDSSKL